MKKRYSVIIALSALIFLGFISASLLKSSVTLTAVNASGSYLYNFTINSTNSPSGINFTQVNITFPSGFTFNISTNGTSTSGNLSSSGQTLSWRNTTVTGIISNGTKGYFWVNATASKIGTLNISVSTLDTSTNTNTTTLSVSVSDITPPTISFASPTPTNASTNDQTYIPVKFTVSDNVAVSNVTILLVKPSGSVTKTVNSSSSYSYNFTNLSNGNYKLNATVYDTSGNHNSTGIRYIILNFTNSSSTVSCTENWTCINNASWGVCGNATKLQFCTNLTDSNNCGTTLHKPSSLNRTCIPTQTCQTNWEKGNWTPSPCTAGSTQTQLWTDLNNCSQSTNKTRLCPTASQTGNSASTSNGKTSNSSGGNVSGLFLGIVGFIIISIAVIVFVLMRMKKRSSGTGDNLGYKIQPHGGGYGPSGNPGNPPGNPPGYGPPRY